MRAPRRGGLIVCCREPSPRLRARHRLDSKSAMVLYEAAAVDDIYGVVTRPCHDAGLRERLKSGEAIFNVGDYADVVRDLVDAGLVTPLDYNGPLEEGRAFGRIEVVLPEPGEEEPEPEVSISQVVPKRP